MIRMDVGKVCTLLRFDDHVGLLLLCQHAVGEAYYSFFDNTRQVTVNGQGWGQFYAQSGSVDIWVASKDLR